MAKREEQRMDMAPLLEGLRSAIDGMAALGHPQGPTARLPRYLAEIASVAGPVLLVMPRRDLHRLAMAVVEGHILSTTYRTLSLLPSKAWLSTFAMVCRGDFYPAAQADMPRDLQAELYLAANLYNAGFTAIEFPEPDLMVNYGEEKIAIAVKRPRTTKSVGNAVRDAVKQARKRSSHCLVCLDLTVAMEQAGKLWHVAGMEYAHPVADRVGASMDMLTGVIVKRLAATRGHEKIGGVLTVAHVPMHDLVSGLTTIAQTWRNKVWAHGSRVASGLIHDFESRQFGFVA